MEQNNKKITIVGGISVGITWVDGSIIFKPGSKGSLTWFGICHFSEAIWAIAPIDYRKATMITTIQVSNMVNYCDRAKCCLHFDCKYNRFQKKDYFDLFKDVKGFSLGLPKDFGTKPLYFNDPNQKYLKLWRSFIIPISGGALIHKDKMKK